MVEISGINKVSVVTVLSLLLCWGLPVSASDTVVEPVENMLVFNNAPPTIEPGSVMPEAYSLALAGEDEPFYMSQPAPNPQKAPPLPLHTIEGVGGGLAVPLAYLVNPGPEGTVVGIPAVSITYLNTSKKKDLTVLSITETFWRRIEVGYALSRFHMGNLPFAIFKTYGATTSRGDLLLHNFNARGLIIEENTFGEWCPAVVAGVQVKYNSEMRRFNNDLGGLPNALGFDKSNGIDYVVTASKTIPPDTFGLPPIILTVGVRNSQASNMGLTGFGSDNSTTIECDIAVVLTKDFAVAYEFRQREDPYMTDPAGLFGEEEDLHALRCAWIINDRATLAAGLAYLGNVANTDVPLAWGLQFKYEF